MEEMSMNRDRIINAMEQKAEEIYRSKEQYNKNPRHGMMAVQVQSDENPARWEATILAFGETFVGSTTENGYPISNGFSFDTTLHEKIAYVRRTGKNSGAAYYDMVGHESFWTGALISDDGKCICGFSGFAGDDDVAVAKAGIEAVGSEK